MSEKLEDKLEKLVECMNRQEVHLGRLSVITDKQEQNLVEHMKRTEANEERLTLMENTLLEHLSFVKGAVYVVGFLITILTLLDKLKLL